MGLILDVLLFLKPSPGAGAAAACAPPSSIYKLFPKDEDRGSAIETIEFLNFEPRTHVSLSYGSSPSCHNATAPPAGP